MLKDEEIESFVDGLELETPDITNDGINRVSFSLAVLITQFYKYSAYVHDDVSLRVKFLQTNYYQLIKLKCVLSGESAFSTVFKKVNKEMQLVLRQCTDVNNLKVHIQWITDDEVENATHLCIITPLDRGHHVQFQCYASSFFNTVFRNAEAHYNKLTNWVARYPRSLIKDINYLTAIEIAEIELFAYGAKRSYDDSKLLHVNFEEIAEKRPNAVAVKYGNQNLSYQEVDYRANRLAHFLKKSGVKPGDFVGLMLNRSPELYISMLGILKAGAAYVPLDTDFPEDRIGYILEDASVKYLISNTFCKNSYAKFSGVVFNTNDELIPVLANQKYDNNPHVSIEPDSPAYIIYTSGSTGRPKGVVVSHASVSNLVKVERDLFRLTSSEKVLQGFSPAFDASIEEIWLAFLSGSTLVPADKQIMYSGSELCEFISKEEVTVLSTVPTLLSTMPVLLPAMQASLQSLKLLILGGEACSHELLNRWNRKGLRIVNTYGPTEATVIATYADFNPKEKITIGKPAPNYAVFMIDDSLKEVPAGVPGELCIAGEGLATGYLKNDALTEEKFIEPKFNIHTYPKRIYRTGDLARFNEGGQIEFLGRIDSQVKLRGYRIELTEVESQLLQLDCIENAVVAVKTDEQQVDRLVAYVSPKSTEDSFDETSIKNFLQKRLASYMIPSLFVKIDEVPTLPSGKVDRKNLPEPEFDNIESTNRTIVEPRDSTEEVIYEVWTKYFAPHPVSIVDNFFLDLGGHSLLAAKMISTLRLERGFHNLSVLDVYNNPTIEKLAVVLKLQVKSSENGHSGNGKQKEHKTSRYKPSKLKHFMCGVFQFFSLYLVFGFSSIMTVAAYLVYFYLQILEHSWVESLMWALASSVVTYPAIIVCAVALKWLLLGSIKPGRYKLWSWFYIRWWFVQNIVHVLGLSHLAGTTLLPILYRLFGMKVGKDVHLETDHFAAFDQISIDDGTTIDETAMVNGFSVQDGYLNIGPIKIGKRCFVGERSSVSEYTVMEDDARLEDLSLLPSGSQIPSGETWAGSPAELSKHQPIKTKPLQQGSVYRTAVSLLYAALIFIIPMVSFMAFIPGIALLFQYNLLTEPFTYLGILPLAGASFVVLLTIEIVILKWILVGRVRAGTYPVHGSFYIRNWIIDQLLKSSLAHVGQLHATLYVASWYRALGTKIGKFVELSTATTSTPDLIHLSDGSTIADEVSLGTPHIEGGWITLAPTKLGQRAFLGNSAVLPSGREMGSGSLVGVLSVAPEHEEAKRENATWFGSPAILFPKREASESFSEERTYRPSRKLRLTRALFELLRITMPPCGYIFVTVSMITVALELWEVIGLGAVLACLPVVFAASSVVVLIWIALMKWIFVGRYKPFVRPLWSNFVWRLEFVNALYEFLAAPLILQMLQGTPFLTWYLRLLGSKIGKHCYFDTTGFLEWDMVEIGDRTAIGDDAVIQTHLFEDRILKASRLKIDSDCSVGAASVVLYDSLMESGSQLNALSLLMKGEVLPENSQWQGIPAMRNRNSGKV